MVCSLIDNKSGSETSDFSHAFSTQRERDPESSLMHYRARSYDSRLGRFVQKDPQDRVIENYRYAGNNPVRVTDPTGRYWVISGASPVWLRYAEAYFGYSLGRGESVGGDQYRVRVYGKRAVKGTGKGSFIEGFEYGNREEGNKRDLTLFLANTVKVSDPEGYRRALEDVQDVETGLEVFAKDVQTSKYAFFQGASLGFYQAPHEIQERSGFTTATWSWRGGMVLVTGVLGLTAAGVGTTVPVAEGAAGAIEAGAGAGGTAAAVQIYRMYQAQINQLQAQLDTLWYQLRITSDAVGRRVISEQILTIEKAIEEIAKKMREF